MSEPKWTPGPWSISWERGNHFTTQQHLNFPDGSGIPLGALSASDANLIAAAPELYEALFMAMNVLGMTKFEPDPGQPHPLPDYAFDRAMRNAQMALAKARGES